MMVRIGNFLFRYRNGLFPIAFVILLTDQSRMWSNDLAAALAGFIIAMSGQIMRALTIGLVYIIRGGKNRNLYAEALVTQGIFAHCRNPLYLGNLLIITGVAIAGNSILFLIIGLPFFFFAYLSIIAAEENYLENKFGPEFISYCKRVNRLIPNLSGIRNTFQGTEFKWKRLISKDYGTIFYWSAGIICIMGKNVWLHAGYYADCKIMKALGVVLVLLMLLYAFARYMKKSGRLREN